MNCVDRKESVNTVPTAAHKLENERDETSVQIEILNHSEIPSSKSIEHFEQEPSVAIEAFWEQSGNWRCELADISSPAGSLIELVLG